MVIIPEREYSLLKQIRDQSIKSENSSTINPTSLPSDQLMIAYNAEMERQRLMTKNSAEETSNKVVEPISNTWLTQAIEKLPKTFKSRASQLYNFLLGHGHNINWNGSGEIKTATSDHIEGSNILDLINFVTNPRFRKGPIPTGLDAFLKALNVINVPRTLISDPSILAYTKPVVNPKPYKRSTYDDTPVGFGSPTWKSFKVQ